MTFTSSLCQLIMIAKFFVIPKLKWYLYLKITVCYFHHVFDQRTTLLKYLWVAFLAHITQSLKIMGQIKRSIYLLYISIKIYYFASNISYICQRSIYMNYMQNIINSSIRACILIRDCSLFSCALNNQKHPKNISFSKTTQWCTCQCTHHSTCTITQREI